MPSWKKVIVSGSDATLNSLLVSNGITGAIKGVLQGDPGSSITGSLQGTASFANFATIATNASMATAAGSATTAATASYVNTLNQNVIITGSAAIGTSSLGPSENTLTLGARDSANEGGQLGLNAPGGTYTSASFFDNWQNNVRILRGSNDTSNATVASWNLHTRQMGLAAYTSPSSFSGTVAGLLAFDSSGNIITTSPGGSGTVTSVSASGTVSGITLGGGTITTSGTLTLSGTISGLTTSNLSATAAITNAQLANSSVTVGSTAISLGGSATTIAGLSSVTSTSFVGALTGNATTATQTTNTVGAGSDADIVYSNMAGNDQFRIRTGGASNAGYVEIATADDGTEPIHVRQYTGVFTSLARTATLLDGSGNTTFPGSVTANSFSGPLSGNATSATTAATASSVITAGSVTGGSHYFLIYTTSPNGGDAGAVRTSNLIYNSATNTLPTTSSWATNATNATSATNAASAALVSSAVTFNNGGSGDASGTSFNGANARTISYNTIGAYAATNPSGYTTNTGTVTSVSASGTVSGLTLGSGGSITTSGTITLSGTISGLTNGQLVNSAITIAGTSTSLGGSISQATILASSGVFSGSAQIPNSSIANAQLANSSITVGSTAISLGSSATTIAGLSSVTSTTFVGALTGNASTATNLSTNNTNWSTNGTITAVVGQLAWKNYNNNHTIFDASAGTAPDGSSINATNSQYAWQSSYPTLMGWNTTNTYGVRVDSSRVADSAAIWTTGRTITIGSTGKTVDGSGNVSWTLGEIGAQAALTNPVTGTGTTNYIPKFTGTSAIGNSVIYDDGTNVGIGTTSPNSKLHVVGNTSITGSTNITGSLLVRNGLGTVLDTTNYNLGDGAVTSVAWGDRTLKDTNNFATVDWEAMTLGSPQGLIGTTVNWGAGTLRSPGVAPTSMSIDWDARIAYDIIEGESIRWNDRTLINFGNDVLNWGNYQLIESNGITSLDWGAFELYSQDPSTSLNWNYRYLYDSASAISVDWNARRLSNPAGSTLLTWDGNSATLTGTSSWATNVVNNGVTSVGGTGTVNGISLSGTVTSTGNLTLGGTLANIQSGQLATSSLMIGSTNISLGATGSTLAGLTSVTATNFVGTASVASKVNTVRLAAGETCYPVFVDSSNGGGGAPEQLYTAVNAAGTLQYSVSTGILSATGFVGSFTGSIAGTASWATNVVNNGVTSVGGTGTVNGISLSGTVTSTGNLTLGGTLSGIGNAQLTNSSITVGSTAISLGASSTTLTGLTSVTSTNFIGTATSASSILAASGPAGTYSIPWMSQKTAGIATYLQGDTILQYVTSTGQLSATTFNGAVTSTDLRVNGFSQKTGSIHILQTSNVSGSGVRLRQQGTANYWDMYVTASTGTLTNGLQFRYNGGNNGGYLDALANAANIDFTGQHRSLSNTINITGSVDLTGLIVVADGTYTNLNNNHLPQINEALPNVSLSTTINDKRVFGVISDKEEKGRRDYAIGSWVSTYDTSGSEAPRLIINSLGEGGMWVCNANGSLENGDYITTSNLPGYGMKQADDILHNYTVAKITEDCLFDSMRTIDFDFSGSAYKKQFVGVTYHCG